MTDVGVTAAAVPSCINPAPPPTPQALILEQHRCKKGEYDEWLRVVRGMLTDKDDQVCVCEGGGEQVCRSR